MGIDATILLPAAANIQDVANAIGISFGCKYKWTDIPSLEVYGVKVTPSSLVGCADINVKAPNGYGRHFFYQFESRGGYRYISTYPDAEGIAIFVILADRFGGMVDFNDCDDSECDYLRAQFPDIDASDGAAWKRRQDNIANTPLLNSEAIARFADRAAQ